MKKRSRFYYNLVEITLAMAVVGIGIAGIMALAEELHLNMFILARKSDSGRTIFTDTERR